MTKAPAEAPPSDRHTGVEQHTIDYIPEKDRGGNVRSLFTMWFGANLQIIAIVTGAISVEIGVPLVWAVIGTIIGNLLGAVAMALHSAQGPELGIPQMIQSRAQFGFFGATLPLVVVMLMYVGFYASGIVLGGEALSGWAGIGYVPAAIIVAAVTTVVTVFGYWAIHSLEKIASVLGLVVFAFLTIKLLSSGGMGAAWHAGGFHPGPFLLCVSLAATYQITYAPYVADYSRYLPSSTSDRSAFWWTYAGTSIATSWMMVLGALAAAVALHSFSTDSSSFLVGLAPSGLHWLIFLTLIFGVVAVNVPNLYGLFMSTTTTVTAGWRSLRMSTLPRAALICLGSVVATVIAVAGKENFATNLENFILFLAYTLLPWTAINLTDFYLVRHERYDVEAIFRPDGIYGRFNLKTLAIYVVSILIVVPFVNTTYYVGPIAKMLDGADLGWIVGIIVPAVLYYLVMRRSLNRPGSARAARRVAVTEKGAV